MLLALMDKMYKKWWMVKNRMFKYTHNFSYVKIPSENAICKFININVCIPDLVI